MTMRAACLVVFAVVSIDTSATAATWYAALPPLGADNQPGTLAAPFATVKRALSAVVPGDTLLIRGGTYLLDERIVVRIANPERKYITIAGYPGECPVFDFQMRDLAEPATTKWMMWDPGNFLILESGYIRLQNIKVTKCLNAAGIMALHSKHVIVERCSTYNTHSSGISAWRSDSIVIANNDIQLACNQGSNECISVSSTDSFDVYGNVVWNVTAQSSVKGGEGIDVKETCHSGRVHDNVCKNLIRQAFYVDAQQIEITDVEIYRNVGYNCSWGLLLAAEAGGKLERIRIHHNLFYNLNASGIDLADWQNAPKRKIYIYNNTIHHAGYGWGSAAGGIYVRGSADSVVVFNNILSQNHDFAINCSRLPGVSIRHNLIDGKTVDTGTDAVLGWPGYVDTAAGDFRLLSNSPAIDAGDPDPRYNDPDGSRGDIGAFPFAVAPSPVVLRPQPRSGPVSAHTLLTWMSMRSGVTAATVCDLRGGAVSAAGSRVAPGAYVGYRVVK